MTTTTTERAAQIVKEIHQHGAVPYACPNHFKDVLVLRVWGHLRVPMQLLLEASVLEQEIIAWLVELAVVGWSREDQP